MTSMVQGSIMAGSGQTQVKLIDRMKEATRAIHTTVENRQFIQDLIKGQASEKSYTQYLVDLRVIYGALEEALVNNKNDLKVAAIIIPELFRAEKLDKDIAHFSKEPIEASQEAQNFTLVIRDCRFYGLHKLVAYVYIRMLGDLFGGRDIGTAVREKWGDEAASFYDYSELMEKYNVESLPMFAGMTYRPAFNKLQLTVQEEEELIKECVHAFELTNELLLSYERQ